MTTMLFESAKNWERFSQEFQILHQRPMPSLFLNINWLFRICMDHYGLSFGSNELYFKFLFVKYHTDCEFLHALCSKLENLSLPHLPLSHWFALNFTELLSVTDIESFINQTNQRISNALGMWLKNTLFYPPKGGYEYYYSDILICAKNMLCISSDFLGTCVKTIEKNRYLTPEDKATAINTLKGPKIDTMVTVWRCDELDEILEKTWALDTYLDLINQSVLGYPYTLDVQTGGNMAYNFHMRYHGAYWYLNLIRGIERGKKTQVIYGAGKSINNRAVRTVIARIHALTIAYGGEIEHNTSLDRTKLYNGGTGVVTF